MVNDQTSPTTLVSNFFFTADQIERAPAAVMTDEVLDEMTGQLYVLIDQTIRAPWSTIADAISGLMLAETLAEEYEDWRDEVPALVAKARRVIEHLAIADQGAAV